MAADFGERRVKSPGELHDAIWSGRAGASPAFALGYAQALYDAGLSNEAGLASYARAAAMGELSRNLDFPRGLADLADEIDMAAFEVAAADERVSDMLSALASALKHGRVDEFKSRWMAPPRS